MSIEQSFTSKKNYLKRHTSSGQASVTGPGVLAAWFNYYSTYTVAHNLGYVPMVRVYYEPYKDGKIYPATGRRLSGLGPGLAYGDTICLWEADTANLTIYLERALAPDTGAYPVYWVIYLDVP